MNYNQKLVGFTLAEVLITLLVVGVVASLVIPNLINSFQDEMWKTNYKKAWSDTNTVWKSMVSDNVITYATSGTDPNALVYNFNQFKNYFSIVKECSGSIGNMTNCWKEDGEDYRTGYPINSAFSFRGFIDNAGRSWWFQTSFGGLMINVDTNGLALPNRYGKDRFFIRAVIEDTKSIEELYSGSGCPNAPSGCTGEGYYKKLFPDRDRTTVSDGCHYPPCYGTSWLFQ